VWARSLEESPRARHGWVLVQRDERGLGRLVPSVERSQRHREVRMRKRTVVRESETRAESFDRLAVPRLRVERAAEAVIGFEGANPARSVSDAARSAAAFARV
jgi:hypothetical protein